MFGRLVCALVVCVGMVWGQATQIPTAAVAVGGTAVANADILITAGNTSGTATHNGSLSTKAAVVVECKEATATTDRWTPVSYKHVDVTANAVTVTLVQALANNVHCTVNPGRGEQGETGAAGTVADQYKIRTCEIHVWGSGTSQVLQDADDEAASCRNKFGVTETITAVECWANAGTPTVTPILTGGGATSILTGALTCGTAAWQAGTLNGTPTLTSNSTIDANVTTAGGTATNIRMVFTLTR